jgi:hypothetical protein
MNPLILTGLLLVALIVGCVTVPLPESSLTGTIAEVKVGDILTPKVITAKTGDEVRWVNQTNSPIHITLVRPANGTLSCRKGFVFEGGYPSEPPGESESLFGATVNSNEFASLCFSGTAIYDYTIEAVGTKLSGAVMVK